MMLGTVVAVGLLAYCVVEWVVWNNIRLRRRSVRR